MRSPGLLFLLVGCSSSAPSSTPDATTTPPDGTLALTCGTTIAAYCSATSCDQSLAAAKQDRSLCPASLNTCGAYEVITKGGIDTATFYFYQGDQLVAVDHELLPGHHTCSAGPATFDEPTCGPSSQNLPACGV